MLLIAGVDPFPEPLQYLSLNPTDPVGAELYPLGEFPDCLQACDMLGRIQDQFLHLTLAQHLHHDTPHGEEHRDAPGCPRVKGRYQKLRAIGTVDQPRAAATCGIIFGQNAADKASSIYPVSE